MKKFLAIPSLALVLFLCGCAPSLYITPEATAPDGTKFWSVATKTNGHPAVTSVQTFRKQGDTPAQLVADHAGSAKGAAVDITGSALHGTTSSLALGLPAALLKSDQTNVNQTGGGAVANGGKAVAFGGQGGKGGEGGLGIGIGGEGGKGGTMNSMISPHITNTNTVSPKITNDVF